MPVYDLSYKPYEGEYRKGLRLWPIMREGFLIGLRTRFLKGLYIMSWGPWLAFSIILFLKYNFHLFLPAEALARGETILGAFDFNEERYFDFMRIPQQIVMVIMVTLVGPGLITEDRKSNSLELYLARPITRWDYLFGKLGAMVTYLMSVTFLPTMVLWGLDCMMAPDSGRFWEIWHYPFRFLAYSLVITTGTSLFVFAIASMTRSTAMGMVYWVATYGISWLIGFNMVDEFDNPNLGYFCFGLPFDSIGLYFFGLPLDANIHPPVGGSIIFVSVICAASFFVLLRRLRGTEVFK